MIKIKKSPTEKEMRHSRRGGGRRVDIAAGNAKNRGSKHDFSPDC